MAKLGKLMLVCLRIQMQMHVWTCGNVCNPSVLTFSGQKKWKPGKKKDAFSYFFVCGKQLADVIKELLEISF